VSIFRVLTENILDTAPIDTFIVSLIPTNFIGQNMPQLGNGEGGINFSSPPFFYEICIR
jgi:hypothetical protein